MYSHTLLTTSVRGSGEEPTTAASSFEGRSGFISAGFGFLAAIVPALSVFDAAIVNLRCYLPRTFVRASCRDYGGQRANSLLTKGVLIKFQRPDRAEPEGYAF